MMKAHMDNVSWRSLFAEQICAKADTFTVPGVTWCLVPRNIKSVKKYKQVNVLIPVKIWFIIDRNCLREKKTHTVSLILWKSLYLAFCLLGYFWGEGGVCLKKHINKQQKNPHFNVDHYCYKEDNNIFLKVLTLYMEQTKTHKTK